MEPSKKSVSILLMRHAESTYNAMQYNWKKENGHPVNHPEDEPKRFIKDAQIIDAILTPKGEQQSIEARPILAGHTSISHVFSSPLRRAVATGKIAMEGHPNAANGGVKFKLIPWFRETMKS